MAISSGYFKICFGWCSVIFSEFLENLEFFLGCQSGSWFYWIVCSTKWSFWAFCYCYNEKIDQGDKRSRKYIYSIWTLYKSIDWFFSQREVIRNCLSIYHIWPKVRWFYDFEFFHKAIISLQFQSLPFFHFYSFST